MSAPRITIAPRDAAHLRDAIEAGGGVVSAPDEADAVVWADPYDTGGLRTLLERAPQVRWVQLPYAGVEAFAAEGIFTAQKEERVWTAAKGVYAEPVAEHALALAVACLRNLPAYARATTWTKPAGRNLYDARVTILGAGGITQALLPLLAPFRARVTVVRRSGQPLADADRTVELGDLHDALGDADVVVVALALTPETTGVIAAAELAVMPDHAVLVNVGRGRHIVTDDLVAALHDSTIGGAGLDVTHPEPLPDEHPLWTAPNCVITPHTGNTPEMARPLLAARIAENVRRFAAGKPLIGVVDPEAGY